MYSRVNVNIPCVDSRVYNGCNIFIAILIHVLHDSIRILIIYIYFYKSNVRFCILFIFSDIDIQVSLVFIPLLLHEHLFEKGPCDLLNRAPPPGLTPM